LIRAPDHERRTNRQTAQQRTAGLREKAAPLQRFNQGQWSAAATISDE
jgi:hypothetical protein